MQNRQTSKNSSSKKDITKIINDDLADYFDDLDRIKEENLYSIQITDELDELILPELDWILWTDNAAGNYWVEKSNKRRPNCYADLEMQFCTKKEAVKYVESWQRNSTVYCVFFNRSAWDGYVSEENDLSGNWRGSMHGHYNLAGEFKTKKEAYDYLDSFFEEEEEEEKIYSNN